MTRLVANGCSYMYAYANGGGPQDLANRLGMDQAESLAIEGACNSRIIRTTIRDSYWTDKPTLYVVGITFLARGELPINMIRDDVEGRWLSTQTFEFPGNERYPPYWTKKDTKLYLELKTKTEIDSIEDRLEHLMYQLLMMIASLTSRGHQVVIFRNPADAYDHWFDCRDFVPFGTSANMVDGLRWSAIQYQARAGVKFEPADAQLPEGIRHPVPGEHGPLNTFLVEYINKHALHLPIL
jgi:hypothetical protein